MLAYKKSEDSDKISVSSLKFVHFKAEILNFVNFFFAIFNEFFRALMTLPLALLLKACSLAAFASVCLYITLRLYMTLEAGASVKGRAEASYG